MYCISLFIHGDWDYLRINDTLKQFDTVQEAEQFTEDYPTSGSPYSRARRDGNWQVVPSPV